MRLGRRIGVLLATLPSQLMFGVFLEWVGVPQVNYSEPGLAGYSQLVLHVAVSALTVYLVGYGIEWAARRWLLPQSVS